MKNLAGFDLTCEDGGNQQMATAYLARWGGSMQSGPVTTACDPFNQDSCADTSLSSVQQHVQNVLFLPYRTSATDNNNIKWALENYGSVYATMYIDSNSSNYNSNTAAWYYRGSPTLDDHAVTIVGWNDSYPASNFASHPPGPGAFIVKNSWGTNWGQNGFFYVSYYDTQFATSNVINGQQWAEPPTVFTAQPTTNYNTNYQYDPLGWVSSVGEGGSTAWGANVFTATSNQSLSAVSLYAGSVSTSYAIYVYTNPTTGPVGVTAYTGPTGTIALPGYYTIPLNTTVPLTAGQKFSVVIEITTPGSNEPIPVEITEPGYSTATGQPGQGYLSANGTSWTDATEVETNMSICIKAFATNVPSVGAPVASAPAVCMQNNNSLYIFAEGSNSSLYYKQWNSTTGWSTSTSLGGVLTSAPAAVSQGAGTIDVFVRGSDSAIWEKTTTNGGNSWSGWTSLGGQIAFGTGPAASSWGSGRLAVFVEGTNGALYQKTWTGSWTNWASLGGSLTSSPAATSPTSGTIDVFVCGTDGAIWKRTTTNGASWSNWASLGGQIASGTGPAASSWGSGRLDVFVEGTNGAMYQKTWNGASWSGWSSLGGVCTSSPAAISPASGTIDVFVRGSDNGLWEKSYYSGTWSVWSSIGGM